MGVVDSMLPYTEYVGREQTGLKHRVLELYFQPWAQKVGSSAKKVWFVDCFAGPWRHEDEELRDTSIGIALHEISNAMQKWRELGHRVDFGAIFVEKSARPFRTLEEFARSKAAPGLDLRTMHGEFGARVGEIHQLIGNDPALLFVDPTGWNGAAMQFIRPLTERTRRRDVLVNVMVHHINRFKDDSREFLRRQFREFFGLSGAQLEEGLSEEELIDLYRDRLKQTCGLQFAADLAVPHPTKEQTKFRLVVGGRHPAILELFRSIEKRVLGGEAAGVRAAARERERAPDQLSLFQPAPAQAVDPRYQLLHDAGMKQARAEVVQVLERASAARKFVEIWPRVLETCHITLTDLRDLVCDLEKEGVVTVRGRQVRERTVKDEHEVELARPRAK